MANILVTGGLGFIGSCLLKFLLGTLSHPGGVKICNVDSMGYGSHPGNIDESIKNNDSYFFLRGDINEIGRIVSNINVDIDVIINVAAETHVDRSINDPSNFIWSNYDGTFRLLEYARQNDIGKFVQVSTDEVYGEAKDSYSFKESDNLNPSNPYSSTKAGADLLVNSYFRTYGLYTTITRCTNNFGPNQFPEKLVPRTIIRILLDMPILLYGKGAQVRDWIYVADHVRAIDIVMRKGRAGHIYNVSASNLLPNIDLVQRITAVTKEKCGKDASIKFIEDRPGHDFRYALDSTKIRSELGWKPETNLDEGLESTVEWYLSNREWWEKLVHPFVADLYPWKLRS